MISLTECFSEGGIWDFVSSFTGYGYTRYATGGSDVIIPLFTSWCYIYRYCYYICLFLFLLLLVLFSLGYIFKDVELEVCLRYFFLFYAKQSLQANRTMAIENARTGAAEFGVCEIIHHKAHAPFNIQSH